MVAYSTLHLLGNSLNLWCPWSIMLAGLVNFFQRTHQVSGTCVWWTSGWDLWLANVLLCFGSALGHLCHLCIRQHGRKLSRRKLVISFYMFLHEHVSKVGELSTSSQWYSSGCFDRVLGACFPLYKEMICYMYIIYTHFGELCVHMFRPLCFNLGCIGCRFVCMCTLTFLIPHILGVAHPTHT